MGLTGRLRAEMKIPKISIERLAESFIYDSDKGTFFWKNRPSSRTFRGIQCGSVSRCGYRRLSLDCVYFYAHRAAWALCWGEWPSGPLDHINGNRLDNRIANLRLATPAQNAQNRKTHSNNKLGIKGVFFVKNNRGKKGRYLAVIRHNGVQMPLGSFDCVEKAAAAYEEAAKKFHGEFARGNA